MSSHYDSFEKIRKSISESLGIPVSRIERISGLTPMQRDIYTDLAIKPDSTVYSLGLSVNLGTAIDRNLWEQAVLTAVSQEDAPRTRFCRYENEPFQFIDRASPVHFEFIDIADTDDFEKNVTEKIRKRYDPNDQELFSNILLRKPDGQHIAVLAVSLLVCDIYSGKIFFERVGAVYEALLKGQEPDKKNNRSFYDYAEESLGYFDSEEILQYWQNRLKNVEPLGFHTGFRTETGNTSETVTVAGNDLQEIKAYCKAGKCSIPAYFMAIYGLLSSRYFDPSEDFVISDIVAGRPEHYKDISGCFYQILPVLFPKEIFGSDVSVSAYLDYIKNYRKSLGHFRNISLFSQKRILTEQPADFFYDFIRTDVNMPGKTLRLNVYSFFSDNQVHFVIEESDALRLSVHYNEAFFSDGPNFLARIYSLSRQIIRGYVYLNQLDVLLEDERHKILADWNNTRTDYPKDKCIHQLFEEQAERTPDAVAVVFETAALTYGELNARANQVAHYLRDMGVGPEVLTGICAERSLDMVVGLLGILKAGGAYVPLDPAYPRERLGFMLSDSQVPVLLTQERLIEKLPGHRARVVCLDSDWGMISQESEENPVSGVKAENLAYILYTSGSTGKPKGVMVEHHSIFTLLCGFEQIAPSGKQPAGTVVCPFSFDVSVWEIFSMLCFGGNIHLLTPETFSSAESFASYLFDHNITSAYIPPALLLAVVIQLEKLTGRIRLHRILFGVEPIKEGILQRFRNLSDQLHIVNGYGPTEATICATFFYFDMAFDVERNTPIGTPAPDYQVYLVDSGLRPVPIGIPGELHIGGVGLARGYLNRPELTAEKFIPNPFSGEPGSRLYKTGDLARYLPDGNIEFLGRMDHQVKIRGFRIELGEIEAILTRHPDVREAAVIAREDRKGGKYLAAYIVTGFIPDRIPYRSLCLAGFEGNTVKVYTENISADGVCLTMVPDDFAEGKDILMNLLLPGRYEESRLKGKIRWRRGQEIGIQFELLPEEDSLVRQSMKYLIESLDLSKFLQRTLSGQLRDYLEQKLPHYMIPSSFVFLKELPLTPNGKVDRRLLSETDTSSGIRAEYVAPGTPVEEALAAIWGEVLGREQIGIHDNFFKLGGHSLLLIQVMSRVREVFQADLPMNSLFEYPVLTQLAKHIDISRWIAQTAPSPSDTEEGSFEEIIL